MRPYLLAVLTLLALVSVRPAASQTRTADVALAPFSVQRDSGGSIRAVADKCLEALAGGLKAKGIEVSQHDRLAEDDVKAAGPALLAVLGEFSRKDGLYSGELQLFEVGSGDELRSYFISVRDAAAAAKSCSAAADRVVAVLKEQKAEGE
jgi:hypothetical protein